MGTDEGGIQRKRRKRDRKGIEKEGRIWIEERRKEKHWKKY